MKIIQLLKLFKNVLQAYKSTLLGLVFICVGLYLLIQNITTDYWIVGGLLIGGLLMFFTGDRFIQQLEKAVFGRILFEKKEQENS